MSHPAGLIFPGKAFSSLLSRNVYVPCHITDKLFERILNAFRLEHQQIKPFFIAFLLKILLMKECRLSLPFEQFVGFKGYIFDLVLNIAFSKTCARTVVFGLSVFGMTSPSW